MSTQTSPETIDAGTSAFAEKHPATPRQRFGLRLELQDALSVGLGLGLAAIIAYARYGYGGRMLVLWLTALLLLAFFFWRSSGPLPAVPRRDLIAAAALIVGFSPLYLARVHDWPVHVNSDEIVMMMVADQHARADDVDPFAVSDYFGHPALQFLLMGELATRLGGIDLTRMRVLHGAFGLALIAAAFAFFRQLMPRGWAVFAAVVLGSSHALFMFSRMAMGVNKAALIVVAALALLAGGLRRDHRLLTFLGGVVAGIGFYFYLPARVAIVLFLVFLFVCALWFRGTFPVRKLARVGAIACTGFALTAAPVVVSAVQTESAFTSKQRGSSLLFELGREHQRAWVSASSRADAFKTNVLHGLAAFNWTAWGDNAHSYPNREHDFVDPITGILLWIGVAAVAWRLGRRRDDPLALLGLAGFVVLWLTFAFVVNQAPSFPRMLVALPFVAYLAAEGVRALATAATRRLTRSRPAAAGRATFAIAAVASAVIAAWNVSWAWDFVEIGKLYGDEIGSTGRYIESHDLPGKTFYFVADWTLEARYWGAPNTWVERMTYFVKEGRVGTPVASIEALRQLPAAPPFAAFMTHALWTSAEAELRTAYPEGHVENVTPDGRLIVLEVAAAD